jgi:hypothetical protein
MECFRKKNITDFLHLLFCQKKIKKIFFFAYICEKISNFVFRKSVKNVFRQTVQIDKQCKKSEMLGKVTLTDVQGYRRNKKKKTHE